jgi:hypothetical protein
MDVSLQVAIDLWSSAVRLRRGEDVGDLTDQLERAREVEELQALAPALALAALAAKRLGNDDRAAGFAAEYETTTRGKAAMYRSEWAPAIARLAMELGRGDIGEDLVGNAERSTPRDALLMDTAEAIVGGAGVAPGVWAALARRWAAYGCPFEQGLAALATGDPETVARGRALLEALRVPI